MIKKQPTAKIYVGIDPAFRNNGFCICCIDTTEDCIVCVENSNLQNETFDLTGNKLVVAKKSRSVGKNMAVSQNTVDNLLANNYRVVDLSPKDKGAKYTDHIFQNVAKGEGHKVPKKVSQDAMDAYKLALLARQKSYLAK
jgi:hypothetical protein